MRDLENIPLTGEEEAKLQYDYIEKAKADMGIGQLGEMLALQFERERLIREGFNDLANKVSHVAIISDAYGYDI